MSNFKQVLGSGQNGEKPVYIDENWARANGIPIIEAQATVSYPRGDLASPQGLDFDVGEFSSLLAVKALYPHWCLWAGDADELDRWIKANEKLGLYKMLRSSDNRSLWAFSLKKDADYFCVKFNGGSVNANDAVYS